jgi:tetratricopeptide (TPR) repeat protein/SAM-dependent methyltransferase
MNRKQRRASGRLRAGSPFALPGGTGPGGVLADLFSAAAAQHQAGAIAEAERRYRYILTLFPTHADSLHNLGLIALQAGNASAAVELLNKAIAVNAQVADYHYNIAHAFRALDRMDEVAVHLERAVELRNDQPLGHLNLGNVRRQQGRPADALACYERALALDPNLAAAHFNIANILFEQGRSDAAIGSYRAALTLEPSHAESHSRLGIALMAQGQTGEAIAHLEQALALKPDLPAAQYELAKAYAAAGRFELAAPLACRALVQNETPETKAAFAQCIKLTRITADESGLYRKLLLRALTDGWCRPRELANVCISLIKLNGVVSDCIARAQAAWPTRLPAGDLYGPAGLAMLAEDELFHRMLECDPLPDIGLERLLTNVRHTMLTLAMGGDGSQAIEEQHLKLYAAIARQCFVNEYVYGLAPGEAERARELQSTLVQAIESGAPIPAIWPITVSAYRPLHTLPIAESLLKRSWPECVRAVLVQQIEEPAQERQIAASIPVLTAIGGDVSRAVRQQYEENPYPRWVRAGPPLQPVIAGDRPEQRPGDILIAGCGTGLSAIELARELRDAQIVAIDLSRASLSYAKRMADNLGLTNLEFAQADITMLRSIGHDFDFIDASGVLHHLADPWEGWRVLLSLLRPGGVMQVGLYSALARRNVVAARELIAARGYQPTAEDIRRCREDVMTAEDGSLLKSVIEFPDFFTTSECRDLLFHVQEHRIALPEIKSFLEENGMRFNGFIPFGTILRSFTARYPERSALTDLDCWHAFETEHPAAFAGMYQFWVQKKLAAASQPATATVG